MLLHIYREGQGQTWRVETDIPFDELKLLDLNLKVFPTSVPKAFKSPGERSKDSGIGKLRISKV